MNLRQFGDPVLVKKAKNFGSPARYLADDIKGMFDLMDKHRGVGLAAPQAGLPIRVCVVNTRLPRSKPIAMINPKLVKLDSELVEDVEGCLSLPGLRGRVLRPARCIVDYTDAKGAKQRIRADGLLARVIQHELDHLDGILFTSKVEAVWQVQEEFLQK